MLKLRLIQLSCFEIFVNKVNDLLVSEEQEASVQNISARSAKDLKSAIRILKAAIERRKVLL